MIKEIILGALAIVGCSIAEAQQSSVQGNWNCEVLILVQNPNQRPFNLQQNLRLNIQSNGVAKYSGTEVTQAGSFPFHGQGQWKFDGKNLDVTGKMLGGSAQGIARQSGYPIPPGSDQSFFSTRTQAPNYLALDEQTGHSQTGIARVATQCRR